MKKHIIILLITLLFIPNKIFAYVTTSDRTEDNLQVREELINDDNIEDILNTPKVNEKEKVYDFADLFTSYEEIEIKKKSLSYIEKYNMDLIIVTIDNNNKVNSSEYAKDFYDYNYFGINDSYDGLLYLIDMDNREGYILTVGKAILMYDDIRIDSLLDKTLSSLTLGNYYTSVDIFIKEAINYMEMGIPQSNEGYEIDSNGNLVKIKTVNWIITFVGALLIPSLILWFLISRHKGIKLANTADTYLEKDSISYGESKDIFLTSYKSRVPVIKSTSSGGGRSGGSTISRGSSGRSHGGGGRKF